MLQGMRKLFSLEVLIGNNGRLRIQVVSKQMMSPSCSLRAVPAWPLVTCLASGITACFARGNSFEIFEVPVKIVTICVECGAIRGKWCLDATLVGEDVWIFQPSHLSRKIPSMPILRI